MKLKYWVKIKDSKGKLIDLTEHFDLLNPDGYDSYQDAWKAIKNFFPGQKAYNYLRSQLVIWPQLIWRGNK